MSQDYLMMQHENERMRTLTLEEVKKKQARNMLRGVLHTAELRHGLEEKHERHQRAMQRLEYNEAKKRRATSVEKERKVKYMHNVTEIRLKKEEELQDAYEARLKTSMRNMRKTARARDSLMQARSETEAQKEARRQEVYNENGRLVDEARVTFVEHNRNKNRRLRRQQRIHNADRDAKTSYAAMRSGRKMTSTLQRNREMRAAEEARLLDKAAEVKARADARDRFNRRIRREREEWTWRAWRGDQMKDTSIQRFLRTGRVDQSLVNSIGGDDDPRAVELIETLRSAPSEFGRSWGALGASLTSPLRDDNQFYDSKRPHTTASALPSPSQHTAAARVTPEPPFSPVRPAPPTSQPRTQLPNSPRATTLPRMLRARAASTEPKMRYPSPVNPSWPIAMQRSTSPTRGGEVSSRLSLLSPVRGVRRPRPIGSLIPPSTT